MHAHHTLLRHHTAAHNLSYFYSSALFQFICLTFFAGGMNGVFAKGSMLQLRARSGVCAGNCTTYSCM